MKSHLQLFDPYEMILSKHSSWEGYLCSFAIKFKMSLICKYFAKSEVIYCITAGSESDQL